MNQGASSKVEPTAGRNLPSTVPCELASTSMESPTLPTAFALAPPLPCRTALPAALSPRTRPVVAIVAAPPRSRPTQPPAPALTRRSGGGDAFAAFARDVAQYPLLRPSEERVLTEKVAYLRALNAARSALRETSADDTDPTDEAVASALGLNLDVYRTTLADCLGARDALVASNMRLVVKIARGVYRTHGACPGGGPGGGSGPTLLDIVQEGALGLLRAAETFDPARGVKFSTYAFRSVTQFCRRAARPPNLALHLPERLLAGAFAARKFRAVFFARHARWPTGSELLPALPHGVSLRSLEAAERHMKGAFALDRPLLGAAADAEAVTFGDMLADDAGRGPDAEVERDDAGERVREALAGVLSLRDARVVTLKFGLSGEPPWSNKGIAREIGVSDTRVSQILQAAMEKLRTAKPELAKLM